MAVTAIVVCAALVLVIFYQFVIGTLADDRLPVSRNLLAIPLERFPNSARLNARFAQNEVVESERDLERAELYSLRAINLSPYDYKPRLTLASAKEASGDRAAAEEALKQALELAPSNGGVHWRMANLLVREGKVAESLDHFKAAIDYDGELLGATLDLIWRASRGNVDALTSVTGDDPKKQLKLARFLLQQSQVDQAIAVLACVDRSTRLTSPDSPAFLNSLIAAGQFGVAHGLWSSLVGADGAGGSSPETLIWNGGFESDILKDFAQFDWSFSTSEYARLNIDATVAHSGSRSLKIAFAGRDTTNLDNGIKQLVVVQPGASYNIECFVKTSDLETPEGPKIVVTDGVTGELIASSAQVAAGSSDWKSLSMGFVAPPAKSGGSSAVYVSIKRKPKYSYDEPTKGSVWFDDFKITKGFAPRFRPGSAID
ncbi:MAG TPA: tetratricopeptide repeat protein [Blastocatellia bacterium]|nr:tetratricopeptide repeat protein [Blastocatellia bacterium]